MPEVREKSRGFNRTELASIAEFVRETRDMRKRKRFDFERQWKEIDRQIRMDPVARDIRSGEKKDWYPDLELPSQFNAMEVILADARRLMFPRGSEWYKPLSEVSDKYTQRWQDRREGRALLSGAGFSFQPDSPFKALAQQVNLDQETADTLVRAVIDHYHRMYDFRSNIDLFLAEQVKYGTGVVRVRPVRMADNSIDFRGVKSGLIGPAVIPCSVKTTYLDDSPMTNHEGVMMSPLTLREARQGLASLMRAAKTGGAERGWMPNQLRKLKPLNKMGQVDIIEGEGDFVIPRSQGFIVLTNFLVTIACGQGDQRVVRMRKNPTPFRSYAVGNYMRDDPKTPYGTSPLMKGRPLQEAATAVMNDFLAASRFSGDPAVAYDRHDPNFAADGGPELFPGALIPADSPNAVEPLKIGDIGGLTNALLALLKQYEDMTGVNDARRGAPVRSHTTTGGIELEAQRGIARTDDFVTANEQGPIRSILYMEYDIIKSVMKTPQPVAVGSGGIEGWVDVAAADLPDNVIFTVSGSAGALSEREMAANFLNAANFAVQLQAAAAQTGQQLAVNLEEIANEAFKRAGIQNAGRFIGSASTDTGQAAAGPGVPSFDEGATEDLLASLVPQPAV